MAPADKDKSGIATILSESKNVLFPRPSQEGHAPIGLLKENILGSSYSSEKSHTGQANFVENK